MVIDLNYRQTKFPDDLIGVLEIELLTENTEDVIKGINYVLDNILDETQRKIIRKKYVECRRVIDVAHMLKTTQTAASTEIYKIIRIMKKPENIGYIQYGLEQYKEIRKRKEIALKRKAVYDTIIIKNVNIEEIDLPPKAYASLKRAGIDTFGDILDLMKNSKKKWYKIQGIGEIYSDKIFQYFKENGFVSGTKAEPVILLKDIPENTNNSIYAKVQKMTEQEFADWLSSSRTDIYVKCTNSENAKDYISETFFDKNKAKNKKGNKKNGNRPDKRTIRTEFQND